MYYYYYQYDDRRHVNRTRPAYKAARQQEHAGERQFPSRWRTAAARVRGTPAPLLFMEFQNPRGRLWLAAPLTCIANPRHGAV